MNSVTRFLLVTLTILPLSNLPAQGNAMLKGLEGKKVRLSVSIFDTDANAGSVEIRGTVFEVRGDSIFVLQHGGQVSRIPLSGIRSLSASIGRDHWQGAQKGALAGAVGGLLFAVMLPAECNGQGAGIDCRADGSKPTTAQYIGENVALGVFVGSLIGGVRGTERWEQVITRQRVTIAPARGGGIRLGVSF